MIEAKYDASKIGATASNVLPGDLSMFNALFVVPTYFGHAISKGTTGAGKKEFDDPSVPVLAREADGLRIVLGTHDYDDMEKPDIQIERRPGGWAIFLHPLGGGGDPSGYVYFLDDGRSFLIPENSYATTPIIEVCNHLDDFPELDHPTKAK